MKKGRLFWLFLKNCENWLPMASSGVQWRPNKFDLYDVCFVI